ncbi:MAG: exodeoxyribonuclease VII large subunit [Methanobacteriaceae archaeon]|nr:exodeoxyribonuclease VII large subunit [Methanobacteriaceae archaeon]
MQDNTIFKIAILTTIIGLIGMILLIGTITPQKTTINKITKTEIDKELTITGSITQITTTKNANYITIQDNTGQITLVIFNTDIPQLKENQQIECTAKVTQYKGQIELILEDTSKLKII